GKLGPFAACTTGIGESLEPAALKIIHEHVPALQLLRPPEACMDGNYFDTAYGESTREATAAISAFPEPAALSLDSTYSGKAAAAFLDKLADASGPVLFWNTFNSRLFPAT